jgi:hypothetical protein
MPVLSPSGVPIFAISDLDNEVILRCENRTTDLSRADIWLRDALLEITSDPDFRNEFDQLEEYGVPFNLTPKTQEYAESNFIPTGDINVATLDILLWQDPPTNLIRRKLDPSHYQKADFFQPTNSLPTEWYRFNSLIGFTPIPDKTYQVQTRMLRMHPINDTALSLTQILIPRDWNEILIWAAVERGFMELLEFEKAAKVKMLLYGDPKYPARPGLLNGRKKRREMEAHRTETPLRPVVRSYMYGHGS